MIHQGIPEHAIKPATASGPITRIRRTTEPGPVDGAAPETAGRRLIRAGPPYSPTTGSVVVRLPAHIAIVDQETLFRTMVVDALARDREVKVVASLDSVVRAREALTGRRLDLLILDVEQRDGSGAHLAAELQKMNPRMRVLIMTRHDVTALIESTKRHLRRPWSYLSKLSNIGRDGLVETIKRVALDTGSASAPAAVRQDPFASLTGQQMAVLRLIADGYTNQQVAERLGLSRRTVENHLLSIYRALGIADDEVNPRVAAVLLLLSQTLKL
ncbi:MAG: response regulator transcription factor [Bifidobacteriaceae bacterium]|nr:response regulator transcription factor [Bifidobacteriaceae bacterium]